MFIRKSKCIKSPQVYIGSPWSSDSTSLNSVINLKEVTYITAVPYMKSFFIAIYVSCEPFSLFHHDVLI